MTDFKLSGMHMEIVRTHLGLTQKQFAKRIGKSRQATISEYENNRKPIPRTVWLLTVSLSKQKRQLGNVTNLIQNQLNREE